MAIQESQENDYIKDSRAVINNNFTELDNGKLSLSGGTMTGGISYSGGLFVKNTADNSFVRFAAGTDMAKGALVFLGGKDCTGFEGIFQIQAHNGTSSRTLVGKPDGTFTWNNSNILTASNYNSYALPLSGGTLTGAINTANNTWNKLGDDASFGDHNVGGHLCIKGLNNTPGITFFNSSDTNVGNVVVNNEFNFNKTIKQNGTEVSLSGHTHSYLPLSGGTLTGTVNGVTPTAGDNSTKLATTAYVQEEIRTHANLPIGYEYFSMNPNVPQGSLPLIGGVYSRSTYADLWAWVQQQTGYLKSEADWQTLSTANNGNVPYYSSGDGSTTFRVPSLKCWIKGKDGTETVGTYKDAGLPNITGNISNFEIKSFGSTSGNGAFSITKGSGYAEGSANNTVTKTITFSASNSDSIYGNSTTVQPESIVGMWLVKAYGVVEDTGTIDEQAYIDDRISNLKDVYLPANYTPLNTIEPITITQNTSNVVAIGSYQNCYRYGRMVTLGLNFKIKANIANNSILFTGCPKPPNPLTCCAVLDNTAGIRLYITTDGELKVDGTVPTSDRYLNACVTYIAVD